MSLNSLCRAHNHTLFILSEGLVFSSDELNSNYDFTFYSVQFKNFDFLLKTQISFNLKLE